MRSNRDDQHRQSAWQPLVRRTKSKTNHARTAAQRSCQRRGSGSPTHHARPDGNRWFTEIARTRTGRITPADVTKFSAGNLWFIEFTPVPADVKTEQCRHATDCTTSISANTSAFDETNCHVSKNLRFERRALLELPVATAAQPTPRGRLMASVGFDFGPRTGKISTGSSAIE
jgi:hypothetical protein